LNQCFLYYANIIEDITMFKYMLVAVMLLSGAAYAQDANNPIVTENYSDSVVTSNSNSTTTVKSPPPSAISPSINGSNSDLCTVGVSGAVQTQILGISAGKTVRDMNCEKLKNAKTLYDMGMKVAAVSVMCQDERVFEAMMNAGTPCPYDGMIGEQAKAAWEADKEKRANNNKGWLKGMDEDDKSTVKGVGAIGGLLLLLLL
jgi:hypothetical protein